MLQNVSGPTLNYDGWFPASQDPIPAPPNPTSGWFLFNLNDDPNEHKNLYNESSPQTIRLLNLLAEAKLEYMEPQSNRVHALGLPELHHGVWAPWRKDR